MKKLLLFFTLFAISSVKCMKRKAAVPFDWSTCADPDIEVAEQKSPLKSPQSKVVASAMTKLKAAQLEANNVDNALAVINANQEVGIALSAKIYNPPALKNQNARRKLFKISNS